MVLKISLFIVETSGFVCLSSSCLFIYRVNEEKSALFYFLFPFDYYLFCAIGEELPDFFCAIGEELPDFFLAFCSSLKSSS